MQKQPDSEDRKMVPRWRSLAVTPAAELVSAKKANSKLAPLSGIDGVLAEWRVNPSIEVAADVLGTTPFHISDEAYAAAALLETCEQELAPGIRSLLNSFRGRERQVADRFGSGVSSDLNERRVSIASLKRDISVYPKNSIAYVELARIYSSLGQHGKAANAFRVALALAPQNRFVVRSAVRFYVHQYDVERAWSIIRNTPQDDPWLLASKVAVADLAEKPIPSARMIERVLDSGTPSQVSELAASLGTLELSAGNQKRARRLFRDSAQSPTDNSVAQLRWANEVAGIPFDRNLLNTQLSFEARTGRAFQDHDWNSAINHAQMWLTDEPFSSRAALTGSFLTAGLLRNFDLADQITTSGLVASPMHAGLHNDRAYTLANLGALTGARVHLRMAEQLCTDPNLRVCIIATDACILYREGRVEAGAARYSEALDEAIELNFPLLAQRAYLHWMLENMRIGAHFDSDEVDMVVSFFEKSENVHAVVCDFFRMHIKPRLDILPEKPNLSSTTGHVGKVLRLGSSL